MSEAVEAVDVGTKSKLLLLDKSITDTDKTNFRKSYGNFYASATESPFQCQFDQTCSVLESNKKDWC